MSGKSALQILQEARKLITALERWTSKGYARDESGLWTYPVWYDPADREPRQWSLTGAVMHCTDSVYGHEPILKLLFHSYNEAAEFNSTHNHVEVLAAFDKAIELAKQERPEKWTGASMSLPTLRCKLFGCYTDVEPCTWHCCARCHTDIYDGFIERDTSAFHWFYRLRGLLRSLRRRYSHRCEVCNRRMFPNFKDESCCSDECYSHWCPF